MELISQMWSLLGLLTVVQNVLPSQLLGLLHSAWQSLQDSLSPFSHMDVPEFTSFSTLHPNDLYQHIHLYLHHLLLLPPPGTSDDAKPAAAPDTPAPTSSSSATSTSPPRLTLSLPRHAPHAHLSLSLAPHHSVEDRFQGHRLLWTHHADPLADSLDERRSFSLRVPKRMARCPGSVRAYLSHVSDSAARFQASARERRLHTNVHGRAGESAPGTWASVPFRHPATFDTLAMDPGLKAKILADLDAFVNGKEYYARIGRAWKRGYLLHGPPGSGKSSLIASMANHLNYDVFDLELTKVADNGELRSLLIQTTNRSVIVIEDIDCSLDLTKERQVSPALTNCSHMLHSDDDDEQEGRAPSKGRRRRQRRRRSSRGHYLSNDGSSFDAGSASSDSDTNLGDDLSLHDGQKPSSRRVTLSGLLNFTDGLWSCCGEERIIVFTTNHRGAVDPALLRPGRMDVHIRLAHCGPHAFRQMVHAYVGDCGGGAAVDDLFRRADACIRTGGALTPAEVGEVLLRNRDDPTAAIREAVAQMKARVPTQALLAIADRASGGESEVGSESTPEEDSWEKGWSTASVASRGKRRRKDKAAPTPTPASWEKKVKFLTRLRSLTKSDSCRRGV